MPDVTNAELHARIFAACRAMFLCSHGPTQNLSGRITGTKEHGRPSGEARPEYQVCLERFHTAKTRDAREVAVLEAEMILANWKRQPEPADREYERGSTAWKRQIANDPRPVAEVARIYSVSRFQVAGLIAQYREEKAA